MSDQVCFQDNSVQPRCLAEAEKHAREIEELENRTRLHIEYAQEKQIEIQNLETVIETYKNQSANESRAIDDLKHSIKNLTETIEMKNKKIYDLTMDSKKMKESFEKSQMKHQTVIEKIENNLERKTIEIAQNKIRLNEITEENSKKSDELQDSTKEIEKLKIEKLNLLKIVQQLAEIGNPTINFDMDTKQMLEFVDNSSDFSKGNDDYENYETIERKDGDFTELDSEDFEEELLELNTSEEANNTEDSTEIEDTTEPVGSSTESSAEYATATTISVVSVKLDVSETDS